jgi:AcrR family transcriptional regulator
MQNAEATKERILKAALGEFSAHGVAGARVDRIAKAAGCNKNLIYIYFDNKETLFTTVLERNLARVYEDMPFTPEDPAAFAGRVFDFSMENPDLLRLLAWSTLEKSVELPAGRSGSHNAKVAAVAQAQVDGKISAAFSAPYLMTSIMALATSWSPAFPFGMAPDEHQPAPAELRRYIVRTIAAITEGSAADEGSPRQG